MRTTSEDVHQQMNVHNLAAVIRGEVCVFRTPPDVNAELLPTDHHQLLVQAMYPIAAATNVAYVQCQLETALRVAATDGTGLFCAIRCYFMQISNEADGTANFRLDRDSLPQFLTARYFDMQNDLKTLVMAEQPDVACYAQRMALRYLIILQEKYGLQITIA